MPHSPSTAAKKTTLSASTESKKAEHQTVDTKATNNAKTDPATENPHIIVDTMMNTHQSRMSVILSRRKKDEDINIGIMVLLLTMVILNFFFAVTYSGGDSGCNGKYTVQPTSFCALAGVMTLPMLILSVVLWCKGRKPQSTSSTPRVKSSKDSYVGIGKGLFCISFWNMALAFVGTLMYIGQFESQCQSEPIAIVILLWSMFQFSFACMSVGACCYLSYHAAAKSASAAEDVMGMGIVGSSA